MRCMLSSCSLMCRCQELHDTTRRTHTQLELELDTVARFLRCRSTELKVLATGRSPPPRGESLASPSGRVAHSCESCVLAGREAASCQSRRAAARPAALAHPVLALWCGRATASSNASRVRPSQAARHWPANCRSSEASEHICRRGIQISFASLIFAREGRRIVPKEKKQKKTVLRTRLPAVVTITTTTLGYSWSCITHRHRGAAPSTKVFSISAISHEKVS